MKQNVLLISLCMAGYISFAQNIGMGTPLPKFELHLHSGTSSFALQMTNNIISDAANVLLIKQ